MPSSTAIKERPILFSGLMVRAILENRKSQTRRVVKPQPEKVPNGFHVETKPASGYGSEKVMREFLPIYCPYGQPGDRLWVRETWATVNTLDHLSPASCWQYERPPAIYYAEWTGAARNSENRGRWRPSIHMPRWASRLTLEITGVRVERVQETTLDDMRAEGVRPNNEASLLWRETLAENFHTLWNEINAARGYPWESNPWVWVVSFRQVQP